MESSVRGRVGGGGGGAGVEALPLPPPPRLPPVSSSPASIRALLARTASSPGVADCQSPRSLLSRILQRGEGGNGGFGCRVRLPRRYSSSAGGGGGREERKDGAEQSAVPRVKVVERAPELPVETPRSSVGKKRPEEEQTSMNLVLGASLVLLLSKSAVELNKMVDLRAQMEVLVSEIRKETTQRKEKATASSSSQESNGSSTTAVIKDPIACAAAEDALSNCSRTADCAVLDNPMPGRTAVVIDQMEEELQVELSRLQCAAHGEERITPVHGLELPLLQVKTTNNVSDSPSRSCVDDDVAEGNAEEEVDDVEEDEPEEGDEEEEGQGRYDVERSPPHGGVSARALERRLHELLQKRQQERIVELQSALDSAQRRLQEKEREVVWWRDAAKLVSHRRDESRRLR